MTGATPPVLELELPGVAAESEGLDVLDARGGVLHWLLTPFPPGGAKPTYGTGHSELLTFVPAADARLRVRVAPARAVAGRTHARHRDRDRALRRARAPRGGRARERRRGARADRAGRHGPPARAPLRRPAPLRVTATKQRLLAGRAR